MNLSELLVKLLSFTLTFHMCKFDFVVVGDCGRLLAGDRSKRPRSILAYIPKDVFEILSKSPYVIVSKLPAATPPSMCIMIPVLNMKLVPCENFRQLDAQVASGYLTSPIKELFGGDAKSVELALKNPTTKVWSFNHIVHNRRLISNHGDVCKPRYVPIGPSGRYMDMIMEPYATNVVMGRLTFCVTIKGRSHRVPVAVAVLMLFSRNPATDEDVEHLDGNIRNCSLSNLAWKRHKPYCTRSDTFESWMRLIKPEQHNYYEHTAQPEVVIKESKSVPVVLAAPPERVIPMGIPATEERVAAIKADSRINVSAFEDKDFSFGPYTHEIAGVKSVNTDFCNPDAIVDFDWAEGPFVSDTPSDASKDPFLMGRFTSIL